MICRDVKCIVVLLLISIASALFAAENAETIIYVDDDAPLGGDGRSWETAYRYLQDALTPRSSSSAEAVEDRNAVGALPHSNAVGAELEEKVEIRVAQGIYRPDLSSVSPEGSRDRQASFVLTNGLTLKGGYAGLTGVDPNAWDVDQYETVLSGDLAGDDVLVEDPCDFVTSTQIGREPFSYWMLLIESTRSENCLHVVNASYANEMCKMEGFTISGGQAYTPPYNLSHPHRAFDEDDYGAGVLNEGGCLCLRYCTVKENASMAFGPGIHSKGGMLQLFDCNVIYNESYNGRQCMVIEDSQVEMEGCYFQGSMDYDFAFDLQGWIWSRYSSLSATNCEFINRSNRLDHYSAIDLYYGEAAFKKCVFSGYKAGVIRASGSNLNVVQCEFIGNSGGDGAAIKLYSGNTAKIDSSVFVGNRGGQGGAVFNGGSIIEMKQCVLAGNYSNQRGGAILCIHTTSIENCVFWENHAPIGPDVFIHSNTTMSYNCFESIQNIAFAGASGALLESGNIFTDPCFVDPGHWNNNATPDDTTDDFFIAGDYHLKSQAGHWDPISESWILDEITSPCIDAGDPDSPIMHEPFPNGGRINMGAYGGTTEASKSYFGGPVCSTIIAGDIKGDCRVDSVDLKILMDHWLEDRSTAGR